LQLTAYRSGKRVNAIMNGMAADLSDEDIATLAAHYGK
jgi:cytochrome c553